MTPGLVAPCRPVKHKLLNLRPVMSFNRLTFADPFLPGVHWSASTGHLSLRMGTVLDGQGVSTGELPHRDLKVVCLCHGVGIKVRMSADRASDLVFPFRLSPLCSPVFTVVLPLSV